MFQFKIGFNNKNEPSIPERLDCLEETGVQSKKVKVALDKYKNLVINLKKFKGIKELLYNKNKKKNSEKHWKAGKMVVDFIKELNKDGIEIKNLSYALSKSIGGCEQFWDWLMMFYAVNNNKEYVKYDWKFCTVLLQTPHPETREILVRGIDEKKINDQNQAHAWKDILEHGKLRELAPGRKKIIEALKKKDCTEFELEKKTGLDGNSIRGRISELKGIHGYVITNQGKLYHLHSKDDLKAENILADIAKIKKQLKDENWYEKAGILPL